MHQCFPIKWTAWATMKSSTTLVTRCQHSRRSMNTWWSHRDMVKKCTVGFSRENLDDNPPSKRTSHHHHTGDHCHHHCRQVSNMWVLHCQNQTFHAHIYKVHVSSLGPKAPWTRSETDSAQQGKMLPFWQILTVSSGDLWNIWAQVQHFPSAMMHQSKPWKHQGFLPPKKA